MSAKVIPFDRLWKVSDVATYLQMSTSWVYKEAEAGRLPVRRFGFALRFSPSDIEAYARGEWQPMSGAEVLAQGRASRSKS